VRQSTLDQVRHHHESRRRQYQFAERARGFGWKEVEAIDEDLGGLVRAVRSAPAFNVWSLELGSVAPVWC
jgi:hypothetical protein